MKQKNGTKYLPEFRLLVTGTSDNDLAAENVAEYGTCVVHHKLSYSPPYESFEGLKQLQIKLRRSPAALGRKVIAAIDISDWAEHLNEEYFLSSVKYFHDRRNRMSYIFTVGDCTGDTVNKIFLTLRCYMRGEIIYDKTFTDTAELWAYIESRAAQSDAAMLTAELLMKDEMKQLRSYPAVNSLCFEMRETSATGVIGLSDVAKYLNSEYALPRLINCKLSDEYAAKAIERIRLTAEKDSVA